MLMTSNAAPALCSVAKGKRHAQVHGRDAERDLQQHRQHQQAAGESPIAFPRPAAARRDAEAEQASSRQRRAPSRCVKWMATRAGLASTPPS